MKLHQLLLGSAIAALSTSSAFAHRFWIIPSTSVLSGDQPWVSFDAAVSNDLFFPNHFAPELDGFTATGPDGKQVATRNGMVAKYHTTFDLQLSQPGTYQVATVRALLFARWEENGESRTWRGSADKIAEIKDRPGVELTDSISRVETYVTSGEPTKPAATGKGMELVFDKTHPNDVFAGEKATFTLHDNGKPAANVKVTVIKGDDRYRNESGELTITTDDNGSFDIIWPEAGRFWLTATSESGSREIAGIKAKGRSSYTATFEVLPQ